MSDRLRDRFAAALARARRLERRELCGFRAWLENTRNLIHVSILLFVPALIGTVSLLSNTLESVSFLLFSPLASATYTLFSDPEGRFAGELTIGALTGTVALRVGLLVNGVGAVSLLKVDAPGAMLAVFLVGAATWAFDLEEPAAFSTALLVLVTKTAALTYVLSVFLSSVFVTAGFLFWRRHFFEKRARSSTPPPRATTACSCRGVGTRRSRPPTLARARRRGPRHREGRPLRGGRRGRSPRGRRAGPDNRRGYAPGDRRRVGG